MIMLCVMLGAIKDVDFIAIVFKKHRKCCK